eukprot:7507070-Alexandrium_andersonii.AAC.2
MKPKKRKKEEQAEAKVEEPKTVVDESRELLNKILSQASAARSFSIALEPFGLSTELVNGMRNHSTKLEGLWGELNVLIMTKDNREEVHKTVHNQVTEAFAWFEEREKIANSMKKQLEKGSAQAKPKAKGKAKGKGAATKAASKASAAPSSSSAN